MHPPDAGAAKKERQLTPTTVLLPGASNKISQGRPFVPSIRSLFLPRWRERRAKRTVTMRRNMTPIEDWKQTPSEVTAGTQDEDRPWAKAEKTGIVGTGRDGCFSRKQGGPAWTVVAWGIIL
jgi:hypothetical protein